MKWLGKAILSLIVLSAFSVAHSAYNFDDLQALEQKKAYREFLDHAHDIRPSARTPVWSEMVSNMATNYMVHLSDKKDYDLATFTYIQTLTDWPELRDDAFFHTKREAYILGYIKHCYQKGLAVCRSQAQEAWNISRHNLDHGTLLAEILATYDPTLELQPFIRPALNNEASKFYCRKDFIQSWLVSKIALPLRNAEDVEKSRAIFTQYAHPACMEAMAPLLQRGLVSNSRDLRLISYRLLKAFDRIDRSDEDLFLTIYLLEGPVVGKTFNLAWAVVREIGQDYARRQSLLKRLAKIDPLPDGIFDSGNELKRDTLTDFLAKNLPEYFTFYADTCVRYRKGLGEYPNGNPTVHCDKFFRLAQSKDWLSQAVKVQYAATLKPN